MKRFIIYMLLISTLWLDALAATECCNENKTVSCNIQIIHLWFYFILRCDLIPLQYSLFFRAIFGAIFKIVAVATKVAAKVSLKAVSLGALSLVVKC
jgi:hypothetical protein